MRALVIGGNGFIGSHVVDELVRQGHAVRVFGRSAERYRRPLNGVDYVVGDFGNRTQISQALDSIDTVYQLVGATLPQASNDNPAWNVQTSIVPALPFLEECVAKSVKKVVYVSSGGTVYGIPRTLPVSEESPVWPICSYGITRLCIERYLEMFRHLHGLDYVVIRPSNAFGPRQDPKGTQGVISVFIGKMIRGETITVWGDGSVVRDYIYVEDLAEGIYAASIAKTEHRVFNMGSGAGVALNDLIGLMGAYVGSSAKIEYVPSRAFDVPSIYLDVSRARAELGWEPRTQLGAGISLTTEFLRAELS